MINFFSCFSLFVESLRNLSPSTHTHTKNRSLGYPVETFSVTTFSLGDPYLCIFLNPNYNFTHTPAKTYLYGIKIFDTPSTSLLQHTHPSIPLLTKLNLQLSQIAKHLHGQVMISRTFVWQITQSKDLALSSSRLLCSPFSSLFEINISNNLAVSLPFSSP